MGLNNIYIKITFDKNILEKKVLILCPMKEHADFVQTSSPRHHAVKTGSPMTGYHSVTSKKSILVRPQHDLSWDRV